MNWHWWLKTQLIAIPLAFLLTYLMNVQDSTTAFFVGVLSGLAGVLIMGLPK